MFTSPKTGSSKIVIHGWVPPADVSVTSVDSYGRVRLDLDYAPAIRPVTSRFGAVKVQLKTNADGVADVQLATAAQYAAFWGSENPNFL